MRFGHDERIESAAKRTMADPAAFAEKDADGRAKPANGVSSLSPG